MRDDFGLARLDGLGDPQTLRSRAEEAMARLEPDLRTGTQQQGGDASDSVWVTVGADGAVVDVSISRAWPRRLAPERLGDAVLEAYRQAEQKRALALARAGGPGARPGGPGAAPRHEPPAPDVTDERWLDWVWQRLDDARQRLDRLASAPVPAAEPERTVPGPAGHVRLRAVGATVSAVLVDSIRLAERDPDAVAGDLRAAFAEVRDVGGASRR